MFRVLLSRIFKLGSPGSRDFLRCQSLSVKFVVLCFLKLFPRGPFADLKCAPRFQGWQPARPPFVFLFAINVCFQFCVATTCFITCFKVGFHMCSSSVFKIANASQIGYRFSCSYLVITCFTPFGLYAGQLCFEMFSVLVVLNLWFRDTSN